MRADAAGERRTDVGEFEIELRVPDGGFGGLDCGLCTALVRGALIDRLGAAEFGLPKLPGAPELYFGQRVFRLRGLQLRNGLVEPDLEWPRVDGEQGRAVLDDLPILECDAGQHPADLCAQLHCIDRRELAKKNRRAGDGLLERGTDRDARWQGRWDGMGDAITSPSQTRAEGR
jgi:hypothetical protein